MKGTTKGLQVNAKFLDVLAPSSIKKKKGDLQAQ